jgi:hypothetical protein
MQRTNYLKIALATVLAAAVLFVIHVYYGQGWAARYVGAAYKARPWSIAHEPYPTPVFVSALATEVFPLLGMVILYLMVQDRLPGRSRIAKGFCFGLLFMFCTDYFVRLPFMNVLVGNPLDVAFIQAAEGWAIYPLVGVVIASVVGAANPRPELTREPVKSESAI